jgi:hypothetical protein
MIKPYKIENEIIYQVIVPIENNSVIIDICYSGDDDEILEFEYSEVSEANSFDKEKTRAVNKILECGIEEEIVNYLAVYYDVMNVNFNPNHYKITK